MCWQNVPAGFVACGAGVAKNPETCHAIVASQTTSVLMLFANALPQLRAAIAARRAQAQAAELKDAEAILKELSPLLDRLKAALAPLRNAAKSANEVIDDVRKAFGPQMRQLYGTYVAAKVGYDASKGPVSEIDQIRYIAQLGSLLDETGVLAVVAAYMYPTL